MFFEFSGVNSNTCLVTIYFKYIQFFFQFFSQNRKANWRNRHAADMANAKKKA